ncbi:hypothetical protein PF003_g16534 [Phytophthora fragariae]|nr:hypothetical protein PF003_g16534 [Phytophthora fragariae]
MQGRALKGKRAIVKLPPSKGKNLQIQCVVSTEVGLLHYETQGGSIKMEENAAIVNAVYDAAKTHPVYQQHFAGKPVVIVLDNAPAHRKTEELVREREDLVLLRLAPYSPMCNPIEGASNTSTATLCVHTNAGLVRFYCRLLQRAESCDQALPRAESRRDAQCSPRSDDGAAHAVTGASSGGLHELHGPTPCKQDGASLRPGSRCCEAR